MERRAPTMRRGLRLCGLVLIGGSLLPAGCSRSPREIFEKAWGPGRACGKQSPGCAEDCGLKTAGIDPTRDPFLTESLADVVTPPAKGTTAAETALADAGPAAQAAASRTKTASTETDPFLDLITAGPSDPGTASDTPTAANSAGDPAAETDPTRLTVAELLRTARAHKEQGELQDAYRAARSAEAVAVMANVDYGPGEDDPAKLVQSLRSELGMEDPSPAASEATAEAAPPEPELPLDLIAEVLDQGESKPQPSAEPAAPAAREPAPAAEFDPFASDPVAPEPVQPEPVKPELPAVAPVRTALRETRAAAAEPHHVRITAGPSMIVESQRVPSRFSDLRSRVVARSNNGTAYAGVVTTSGRRGRQLVELSIPEEASRTVRVTANETGVIEIEAPGEKAEIIPGLALEQANPDALPSLDELNGLVPMPLEPASTADVLVAAPATSAIPGELPHTEPLPPAAAPLASAKPKDTTRREIPNIRWAEEPAPVAPARRWPDWLPLAGGGGLALLGLIAFVFRRR